MYISKLKLSGALNTIQFVMDHQIDLRTNREFIQIINNESIVNVYINDLNFAQVFSLLTIHRNHMRVLYNTNTTSMESLRDIFTNENADRIYNYLERCRTVVSSMHDHTDEDGQHIQESVFNIDTVLPMMDIHYDIILQYPFQLLFEGLMEDEVYSDLFQNHKSLEELFANNRLPKTSMKIMVDVDKQMEPYNYSAKTDQVLRITKYAQCNPKHEMVYMNILSFFKDDILNASVCTASIFNSSKEQLRANMKELQKINAPLSVSFSVQMPIFYLFRILMLFPAEMIKLSYLSSINQIISNDISYITNSLIKDETLGEFAVRISECYLDGIKLYQSLLQDTNIFPADCFAILPSMMMCNAVLTVNYSFMSLDIPSNEIIAELIMSMKQSITKLESDINNI